MTEPTENTLKHQLLLSQLEQIEKKIRGVALTPLDRKKLQDLVTIKGHLQMKLQILDFNSTNGQ